MVNISDIIAILIEHDEDDICENGTYDDTNDDAEEDDTCEHARSRLNNHWSLIYPYACGLGPERQKEADEYN